MDEEDSYVSIDIGGGLGNQLFQLAMVTHYAKTAREKKQVVLKYEENLPNKYDLPRKTFWDSLFKGQFNVLKADEFNKLNFSTMYEQHPHIFQQPPYEFGGNIMFKGYFQSFNHIDNDLRDSMKSLVYSNIEYYNIAKKYYNQIKEHFGDGIDYDDMVSIHIRRTDYVLDSGYHYNLGLDYYRKALEIADKKYVVVFSDDIQWCKQNIARNLYNYTNIYFVDLGIVEFEFILMSMFKHNIIANSTFSLWASFISPFKDKTVIAPKNWYSEQGPQHWDEIYHKYITHII
jgi:tetratricopeptide (TPR) repeat protein